MRRDQRGTTLFRTFPTPVRENTALLSVQSRLKRHVRLEDKPQRAGRTKNVNIIPRAE